MQPGLKRFSTQPNKALGMTIRFKLRGQALVEFAIILILLVLVVAGGAELAITAYGSSKVSDAAKAGATEWGQMISHARDPNHDGLNTDAQNDVGLGDHAVANFASPSCGGPDGAGNLTYDDGIPTDRYLLDKKNRDNFQILVVALSLTKSIYLFNPLPIDHESCFGTDPNRGDRSRISILINGFGLMYDDKGTPTVADDTPNPLYVPGLPKVNQAMYSMYQQVCLNAGNELARCDIADERLLFPPGKLCLGTGVDEENCPDDGDIINVPNLGDTGYFFFGASNNAPRGSKQFIPSLAPEFRPTFQITCPGGTFEDSDNMSGCDDRTSPQNNCWVTEGPPSNTSVACQLQVHVRYRSIFESFITFGLAELPNAELGNLPYFYNPSKVGVAGSNSVKGIAGSEIGPLGASGNPTVKPFKDFRGCYESVNPGSLNYQVVSCN
jgi:TadE-like protein